MKIILYTANDEASHKALGAELRKLPDGEYCIEVKKNRPIRSMKANKYYFAILKIIGTATGHTHEELHEIMKLKFNSDLIHFPKSGSQIIGKTTSDLDTAEFAAYINRVKKFSIEEFGLIIPEPKDLDYARWMEIENSYNRTFSGF